MAELEVVLREDSETEDEGEVCELIVVASRENSTLGSPEPKFLNPYQIISPSLETSGGGEA